MTAHPYPLDPWTARRLQRGAEHLHQLGPDAVAGFLGDLTERIGGLPAAISLLVEYERLDYTMLRATGGDPPRPL